jgi:protein-L-isoaspartate(D-aspartate) O-methyltransferase
MIEVHLPAGGVHDPRVLAAMARVPRERYVPTGYESRAYADSPLPIGYGQTISQPACVGLMTQLLELAPDDDVLEIGTGCGYQTAILCELAGHVSSIERIEPLAEWAARNLREAGYENLELRVGDGYRGWGGGATFDAIILTAAPDEVPRALTDELRPGGRLVAPVGAGWQQLVRVRRDDDGLVNEMHGSVRFVPMLEGVSRGSA